MGLFGPPDVEKMKAKRDIDGLIKALDYQKDESVRAAAAQALGEVGDARAVEPLTRALRDYHAKKEAANALAKIGNARAIDALVNELEISDTRELAAMALVNFGGASAVKPLIAALDDRDKCMMAVSVLEKIGWQPGQDESGAAFWLAQREWNKCVLIGKPAVELLISALKDNNLTVREKAAKSLGEIGDARAVEPLIETLFAAAAPISYGNGDFLGIFRAAAKALVMIGAPAAEPLTAALKIHGSSSVVQSLYNAGWRPGSNEDDIHFWIQLKDWEKCIEIGAPAVEPLIAVLRDRVDSLQSSAADVLVKIGAPAVLPLIAAIRDAKSNKVMVGVLGRLGERVEDATLRASALEPLIVVLTDADRGLRPAAALALGKITALLESTEMRTRAMQPLIAALLAGDPVLRKAAANSLEKIGWQPGIDGSAVTYWIIKEKWDECIRIGAPAIQPLIGALKDAEFSRQGVAETLGKIGDTRAGGPLIMALQKTGEIALRQSVARALIQLYQRGQLSEVEKDWILSKRSWLMKKHEDHHDDGDEYHGNCSIPTRVNQHTDEGLGVDFPL